MEIFQIPTVIIRQKVKEHKIIKQNLLKMFDNSNSENINNEDLISKTDWLKSQDMNREYINYFVSNITPYIKNIGKEVKANDCKIIGMWYQQYYKNDKHNWHNHGGVNWANIYYVELPEKGVNTQFYDIVNKKILLLFDFLSY